MAVERRAGTACLRRLRGHHFISGRIQPAAFSLMVKLAMPRRFDAANGFISLAGCYFGLCGDFYKYTAFLIMRYAVSREK